MIIILTIDSSLLKSRIHKDQEELIVLQVISFIFYIISSFKASLLQNTPLENIVLKAQIL